MKVAIVHDFLVQMGGGEKVVETLHAMYPDAPIYTSIHDRAATPAHLRDWDIRTSLLQRLPFKGISSRMALFLYPLAFESFDLTEFDVVISSSSAFAKGVITQPGTAHVCYCHTPMRFAWTTKSYLENERINGLVRPAITAATHYLRHWDALSAMRVDQFVANSSIVSRRILKYYRADSVIIHPPVDTGRFSISAEVGNYYLIVSRAIPYKRLDLAVAAFSQMKLPLKIAGAGRQIKTLRKMAGPNVEFLGRVSDAELEQLYAHAKGYVMPGEEDFGIAPVEANACGRPVIAYGSGGALDSQIDGETGVLFPEQTVQSLCDAVHRAEATKFDPLHIRRHAQQFDTEVFKARMHKTVLAAACAT